MCGIDGCGKPHRAKGYCSGHYQQAKNGRALTGISGNRTRSGGELRGIARTMDEYFWLRVEKTDSCWLWLGKKSTADYGYVQFDGSIVGAHRYSWELANGKIPSGTVIDHLCHIRSCVNPEHLRVASHKQNMENLRGPREGTKSGVRGVYWDSEREAWRAEVKHNHVSIPLGRFDTIAEAEIAAIRKRKELFSVTN